MAQNGPITLTDSQANNITFEPSLSGTTGTYAWADFSEASASLRATILGSCKTSTGGVKRGRLTTQLPYVDGEGVKAGFVQCEIQLLIPSDAPSASADDVVSLSLGAVENQILSDLIKDGRQPY